MPEEPTTMFEAFTQFLRQHFLPVWLGSLAIAIILLALVIARVVDSGVRGSELRACTRLNIVRASENRSHYEDFLSDEKQYAYDRLFAQLVLAGLKHQTSSTPRTPEQERQTRLFLIRLNDTAAGVKQAADGKDWIALTDCDAAVYSNAPANQPVRFSKQLPPASVYAVGRGQ